MLSNYNNNDDKQGKLRRKDRDLQRSPSRVSYDDRYQLLDLRMIHNPQPTNESWRLPETSEGGYIWSVHCRLEFEEIPHDEVA